MDDHSASRRIEVLRRDAPHLIAEDLHGEPLQVGETVKLSLVEGGNEVGFLTIAWRVADLPHDLQVIVSRIDESATGNVRTTVI